MGRYDYSDPGTDSDYCDGLSADDSEPEESNEPYRCIWCECLLYATDTDYCSALCANFALQDSNDR